MPSERIEGLGEREELVMTLIEGITSTQRLAKQRPRKLVTLLALREDGLRDGEIGGGRAAGRTTVECVQQRRRLSDPVDTLEHLHQGQRDIRIALGILQRPLQCRLRLPWLAEIGEKLSEVGEGAGAEIPAALPGEQCRAGLVRAQRLVVRLGEVVADLGIVG